LAPVPTTAVHDRRYALGLALVLLAGVFWSLAGIMLRNIEAATGWQIVFYRSASFVVVMLVVLAARHRSRLPRALAAIGWAGVIGGVCLAAANMAVIIAMLNTTIANVLFIFASAPFFAALLGRLVLKEMVPQRTWAAIAVALAGVGLMVVEGLAGGGLFGNLMGLVMTLAFAALVVVLRWGRAVDMLPTMCLGGVLAGAGAALLADSLAISPHDLMICVVLGTVQIGCGMVAFTIGSRYVPAALLGLGAMTEVVFGPLWVWLGAGAVPSWLTLVGGAVVLGAVGVQAVWVFRGQAPVIETPPSG
jgi:drug/metabolite transporter (DMT)-like permease